MKKAGWKLTKKDNKYFLAIVGVLFSFISALHLVRASLEWDMVLGNIVIPVTWSWYAGISAAIFSMVAFSLIDNLFKHKK